jgi:hypothetical protein
MRITTRGVVAATESLRETPLSFQGHVLAAGDFVATWAVELAVHHLDLTRELNLPTPAPAAQKLATATIEALAGVSLPASWTTEMTILVGTGRLTMTADQEREAGRAACLLPVLK